jgi:hypothetical protein
MLFVWVCDACWGDPHKEEKTIGIVQDHRACELCGSDNGGNRFHPLDPVSEIRRLRARQKVATDIISEVVFGPWTQPTGDVIERAVKALAATNGGDWEIGGPDHIRGSEEGESDYEKHGTRYGGKLIAESVYDAGNLAWIAGSKKLVQELAAELIYVKASTVHAQVTEFHKAFGQTIESTPTIPDDATVRLRAKLITEECIEKS